MKNRLIQIAVIMAAVLEADAQTPKKPPVLDVKYLLEISEPRAEPGCPVCCGKRPPLVAESLSPAYASKLPDCDRVEVFLLTEDIKPGTAADRFPIRPDHGGAGIMDRRELKGAGAAKLCSLWRGLTFDNGYSDYAPLYVQSPVYGLRFHLADKLVFETSVSFKRHRFSYPRTVFPVIPGGYSWHGFRTGDDAGKALSAFLKSVIPAKPAGE